MVLFGRFDLGPQIRELGAVQSNSACISPLAGRDFMRKFDVREQRNGDSVERFGRQVAQAGQFHQPRRPLLQYLTVTARHSSRRGG